jgi:hypothetical protein
METRCSDYGENEMRDYARIDTSEKPDFANKFCEACGLVAAIVVIVLITMWAAS